MVLMNKTDLKREAEWREGVQAFGDQILQAARERGLEVSDVQFISARTGKGTDELLKRTWGLLPEGPLFYPDEEQLSDKPTRFFVAEKIREQLFLCLGQELPYGCAVEIQKFEEAKNPPRIEAVIHVERDSQKGMVIGKGGTKIKEIGSNARHAIERFLGQKVFLGLKVDVLKDWTRDADTLKKMGYHLPPDKRKKRVDREG
jgi:GTP-binding protein Era